MAAGELRAQRGQGFQEKPLALFAAASVQKRNPPLPSPPERLGLSSGPAWPFVWRRSIPGTAVPIKQGAPIPPGEGGTTQPRGRREADPETPKHNTQPPCSQPPAWGGVGGMLQRVPHPSTTHQGCPRVPGTRAHPEAVLLGGRLAPAQPRVLGKGGSGFIRAGTLPQQEAGAPAGLAPRQRQGGQSKTANKEQNLPF